MSEVCRLWTLQCHGRVHFEEGEGRRHNKMFLKLPYKAVLKGALTKLYTIYSYVQNINDCNNNLVSSFLEEFMSWRIKFDAKYQVSK